MSVKSWLGAYTFNITDGDGWIDLSFAFGLRILVCSSWSFGRFVVCFVCFALSSPMNASYQAHLGYGEFGIWKPCHPCSHPDLNLSGYLTATVSFASLCKFVPLPRARHIWENERKFVLGDHTFVIWKSITVSSPHDLGTNGFVFACHPDEFLNPRNIPNLYSVRFNYTSEALCWADMNDDEQ